MFQVKLKILFSGLFRCYQKRAKRAFFDFFDWTKLFIKSKATDILDVPSGGDRFKEIVSKEQAEYNVKYTRERMKAVRRMSKSVPRQFFRVSSKHSSKMSAFSKPQEDNHYIYFFRIESVN